MTKSIGRFLRSSYDVTTANGSAEAFGLIPSCDPSVIVSDYRMPEGDGVDFLTEVALHHPAITRILFTGFADVDTLLGAINRARVFRVLLKPVAPDELRAAIEAGVEEHVTTATTLGLSSTADSEALYDFLVAHHMPEAPRIGRQLAARVGRIADELGWSPEASVLAAEQLPSVLAIAHGRSTKSLLVPEDLTTFATKQIEMLAPAAAGVARAAGMPSEVVELVGGLDDLRTSDPHVAPELRLLRFALMRAMANDTDGVKALLTSGRHSVGLVEAALRAEDASQRRRCELELVPVTALDTGDVLCERVDAEHVVIEPGQPLRFADVDALAIAFAGCHLIRRSDA